MAHCIVPERSHSRTFARTRDRGTRSRRQRRGLQTSPGRRARHAIGLSAIAATPMKLRVAIPPRSAWRRSASRHKSASLCATHCAASYVNANAKGLTWPVEVMKSSLDDSQTTMREIVVAVHHGATRQVHPRQWAGKATAYKRSLRVGSLLSDEEKKRVEPQWENRPRPCLRILSCSACRGPSGR